jgi:serine/threonine protein kinase
MSLYYAAYKNERIKHKEGHAFSVGSVLDRFCPSMGNCVSSNPSNVKSANEPAPVGKGVDNQIKQWIRSAKEELEQGKRAVFGDNYETSRIVGHGAFAKVVLSTHKATKMQYAVKMLQKNAEDPVKQRDGDYPALIECHYGITQ